MKNGLELINHTLTKLHEIEWEEFEKKNFHPEGKPIVYYFYWGRLENLFICLACESVQDHEAVIDDSFLIIGKKKNYIRDNICYDYSHILSGKELGIAENKMCPLISNENYSMESVTECIKHNREIQLKINKIKNCAEEYFCENGYKVMCN